MAGSDRVVACAELAPLTAGGGVRSLVGGAARGARRRRRSSTSCGAGPGCRFGGCAPSAHALRVHLGFSIVPHEWLPEDLTDCPRASLPGSAASTVVRGCRTEPALVRADRAARLTRSIDIGFDHPGSRGVTAPAGFTSAAARTGIKASPRRSTSRARRRPPGRRRHIHEPRAGRACSCPAAHQGCGRGARARVV